MPATSSHQGFEQLPRHPERELALQLTAPRRVDRHPRPLGTWPQLCKQRSLPDARASLDDKETPLTHDRGSDELVNLRELRLTLEKVTTSDRGSSPAIWPLLSDVQSVNADHWIMPSRDSANSN